MAIMTAFSIVLVSIPFLRFIPFPIAPFLEYDMADIPIMLATFIYGPSAGLIVTVLVSLIQGLAFSSSGIIGIIMHIFATGTFVMTGGVLFKVLTKKTRFNRGVNLIISITVGVIGWLVAMVAYNLIFTPIFMGVPFEAVIKLLLPAIIPFNAMKAGINGLAGGLLYLALYKVLARHIDNEPLTDQDIENIEKENEIKSEFINNN